MARDNFSSISDPTDLRNSLSSSSSAFALKTISSVLSDSGSRGKKPKRSVEISYNNEYDDSSSLFHSRGGRGKRKVELDNTESFDQTNPFSNARAWRDSGRKGSGKSGSGSLRKSRR